MRMFTAAERMAIDAARARGCTKLVLQDGYIFHILANHLQDPAPNQLNWGAAGVVADLTKDETRVLLGGSGRAVPAPSPVGLYHGGTLTLAEQLRELADKLPAPDETVEQLHADLAAAVETIDEHLLTIESLRLERDTALIRARDVDKKFHEQRLAIGRLSREFAKACGADIA